VESLLKKAKNLGIEAELFTQTEEETTVSFVMNKLKTAKTVYFKGWGLRAIKNGRLGFSSSTCLDEKLLDRALFSMPYGPEVGFKFPEFTPVSDFKIYDSGLEKLSLEAMENLGRALRDELRFKFTGDCDVVVRKVLAEIELANFHGRKAYIKSYFALGGVGHLIRESDFLEVYEVFDSCGFNPEFKSLAKSIKQKMRWASKIQPLKSKKIKVIFTPKTLPALLEPLLTGINGHTLMKGTSPLRDKLETQIFDNRLSLQDHPHKDWAIGSAPFDAEGLDSNPKFLIEKGILKHFITDLYSASKLGILPSGNARRSFNRLPHPGVYNIICQPGDISYKEMLDQLDEGLIVDQVLGSHTGNPLSGDFSLNIDLGFYVNKGEIAGRVKNVMVSGNIYKLFKRVLQISRERNWFENCYLPYILFDKTNVSSKE
jgi:PmbA protein